MISEAGFIAAVKSVIKDNLRVDIEFTNGRYQTPAVTVRLLLEDELISTSECGIRIRGEDLR